VLGYAYPAYDCYKTVKLNRPDVEQLRFWCQYWFVKGASLLFYFGPAFTKQYFFSSMIPPGFYLPSSLSSRESGIVSCHGIVRQSWRLSCTCGTPGHVYVTISFFVCLLRYYFLVFFYNKGWFQGTAYVYESFLKPYIAKHETEIDRNLLELRTRAGDMAGVYFQRIANYAQTRSYEILQYIASQSQTQRPRSQVLLPHHFVLLLYKV
jgi:receptor expression-enhancing protein 1/2/3/4